MPFEAFKIGVINLFFGQDHVPAGKRLQMARYLQSQGINIHIKDFDDSYIMKEREEPPLWNFTVFLK